MATIYRMGGRWRAQVCVKRRRDSGMFRTRQEAAAWAVEREAELSGRSVPRKRLSDALERYAREVSPTHAGRRWEEFRLAALGKLLIAKRMLADLGRDDFADWRDARLRQVSAATALREMNLLRSILSVAQSDWGWLRSNPMAGVRRPKPPPSRKRRISEREVERISMALGLGDGLRAETAQHRTGLAFLFAIETAMRSSEIVRLHWPDVRARHVHLPKSKNGDARDVPLTRRAVELLNTCPKGDGPVFGLTDAVRDVKFRDAREATKIQDLHFHDTRSEGIWRLSKKLDVLQLARAIGHRDPKSLLLYYSESADDMAMRLDAGDA